MKGIVAGLILALMLIQLTIAPSASAEDGAVHPPFGAFRYPASVVGPHIYWATGGGGCGNPCTFPPPDASYPGQKYHGITYDSYSFDVVPLGVLGDNPTKRFPNGNPGYDFPAAGYTIDVAGSSTDAAALDKLNKSQSSLGEGGPNTSFISLAHPANNTEWVRAYESPTQCTLSSGLVYRNLELYTVILSRGIEPIGQTYCMNELLWVLRVERLMLATAMSYRATSSSIHQTTPSTVSKQPADALIFPHAATFRFPDLGTYQFAVYEQEDRGAHDYWWHTLRPFDFTGDVAVDYHVKVEPSARRAIAENGEFAQKYLHDFASLTSVVKIDYSNSALKAPQTHAWGIYLPSIHCNMTGGLVYRNLLFLVSITSQDDLDTCNSKVGWTTRLQRRLLQVAEAYTHAH